MAQLNKIRHFLICLLLKKQERLVINTAIGRRIESLERISVEEKWVTRESILPEIEELKDVIEIFKVNAEDE